MHACSAIVFHTPPSSLLAILAWTFSKAIGRHAQLRQPRSAQLTTPTRFITIESVHSEAVALKLMDTHVSDYAVGTNFFKDAFRMHEGVYHSHSDAAVVSCSTSHSRACVL